MTTNSRLTSDPPPTPTARTNSLLLHHHFHSTLYYSRLSPALRSDSSPSPSQSNHHPSEQKSRRMKIGGFTLSPGGLLLPYHSGALAALDFHGLLKPQTHISGASAGSIACMAHGCGIPSEKVLEATIQVSDECERQGGARGRLLPLLKAQMDQLIFDQEMQSIRHRPGTVGLAYHEVFPKRQSHIFTQHLLPENEAELSSIGKNQLITAVSASCSFPFFATNLPCYFDWESSSSSSSSSGVSWMPRVLVDGFFSTPRSRFGCPEIFPAEPSDADHGTATADGDFLQEVAIIPFPRDSMNITAFDDTNCISYNRPISEIFRLATQATSRAELTKVYEDGYRDAEDWALSRKSSGFVARSS